VLLGYCYTGWVK